MARKLRDLGIANIDPVVAQYFCELAETAIRQGRYDHAGNLAAEALKTDPRCVRAIIQSGRLAALHGLHLNAIETWKQVESVNSVYLGEVLNLIATSFRAVGGLSDYRAFLESVVERQDDVRIMFALVEVLDEQEGRTVAEDFLVKWLRKNPTIFGLYRLIELKLKQKGRERRRPGTP